MPPIAIGIDLGTTYSCVATFRYGNVEIIPTTNGKRTIPSMVAFTEHERLIGEEAWVQAGTNSENTVYDTKRLIGRNIHEKVTQDDIRKWPFEVTGDHNGNPVINVRHRGKHEQFRPEEISAMILERLKKMAEEYTGECVEGAVITIPAYFNNGQREATKRACEIAQLNVIRLLNEPTAAAVAYGLENREKDVTTILIVDLGGGTFDVTILKIEDGIYEVKATNGDTHLGGEDFDYRLVVHCLRDICDRFGMDISHDKKAKHRLKMECENVKRALSTVPQVSIELQSLFNNKDYRIQITRQKFEELNKDLFLKLLGPIDEALQQADMSAESIDGIVLVGGSTRIPKIQEMLKKKFPRSSINKDISPDEAVAHGAAIQAAKLDDWDRETLQEMTLLDVTLLSLGIETAGGLMSVVIPRNTAVPVTKTKIFSTHKDGQTTVRVKVFEGERPLTKENNQLGDFRLTGIRPTKSTKVEVAFNVDSNGILNVTAKELGDGTEKTLGLTIQMEISIIEEEVQEMIQKAKDMRLEDEKEKERVQAKVNLETLCLKYQSELRSSQATGRVPSGDRDKVFMEVAKMLSWLETNPGNPKEDYEKCYQQMHDTCEPLHHKIYDDIGPSHVFQSQTGNSKMSNVIGIDLGTTYSCVAAFKGGKVEIFSNENSNRTTPSVVAFTKTERLIGEPAKSQAGTNLENTVYDAKRLIGRKYSDEQVQTDKKHWPFQLIEDLDQNPRIKVNYKDEDYLFRPEEISAMILERMKKIAEETTGKPVTGAVITVPAYFDNAQREATKLAGMIAQLNVMRLLNEPTAAAMAYGFGNMNAEESRNILIFDLGGGTFDVTIMNIEDGIYDTKAIAGNTHLGGQDFDSNLVEHCVQDIKTRRHNDISTNKKALHKLRMQCESAKKHLSNAQEAHIDVDFLFNDTDYHTTISRKRFEEINDKLFGSLLEVVTKAMDDAKLSPGHIHDIVLIGGSTRIPKIQELLREHFPDSKINKDINPDEAVAYGAAIQAAKLGDDNCEALREMVLLDATPLSLGIETAGGVMSVIIPRNTTVPVTRSKIFSPHKDSQQAVRVQIFEGERQMTRDNKMLGDFRLTGIRSKKDNHAKIEVELSVDTNGILKVTAKDTKEGNVKSLDIRNQLKTLSEGNIKEMIKKAEQMRLDDEREKDRVKTRVDLERMCYHYQEEVRRAEAKEKIRGSEREQVLTKVTEMLSWLEANHGNPKDEYQNKHKELQDFCEPVRRKIYDNGPACIEDDVMDYETVE